MDLIDVYGEKGASYGFAVTVNVAAIDIVCIVCKRKEAAFHQPQAVAGYIILMGGQVIHEIKILRRKQS